MFHAGDSKDTACVVQLNAGLLQDLNHFKLSAVNRDLKQVDGYTYDLEWSPSGFKAPSLQHVSFTAPSLIEYALPLSSRGLLFSCALQLPKQACVLLNMPV